MQFTFTKTYPDELPIIETQGGNITENDEEELISFLKEEVQAFLFSENFLSLLLFQCYSQSCKAVFVCTSVLSQPVATRTASSTAY